MTDEPSISAEDGRAEQARLERCELEDSVAAAIKRIQQLLNNPETPYAEVQYAIARAMALQLAYFCNLSPWRDGQLEGLRFRLIQWGLRALSKEVREIHAYTTRSKIDVHSVQFRAAIAFVARIMHDVLQRNHYSPDVVSNLAQQFGQEYSNRLSELESVVARATESQTAWSKSP